MKAPSLFYNHEPEDRIMIKKDRAEVANWTDDLEYINEELDDLIAIENGSLSNPNLYPQLQNLRRENQLILGVLYRYEGTMRQAVECDTTACDSFYLHNHEKNRNRYREHLKKYRNLKSRLLAKIVANTKK